MQDYESLSPVAHVQEPSDRGPVLEQLLDHLDPAFDGTLPPNAYVHGPQGSGKSAVVTALFSQLKQLSANARSAIGTSTRTASPEFPAFAYVDARTTTSDFAFYHGVLDALVDEPVPEQGISTSQLRERLHDLLDGYRTGVVIAVDHVREPGSSDADDLVGRFAGLPSNVSWVAIGRADPSETELTEYTAESVHVEPYRRQTLVNVLMTRASSGLAHQALTYEHARRIADWADGNAHDALAALFVAADHAEQAGRTQLTAKDVDQGIEEMPRPCVSLGRVLALKDNRKAVLRSLVDLGEEERSSVTATTEAIGSDPNVDLSAGTVKRFLYEMAEIGIVDRVRSEEREGRGRPPSRVELRFPPTVFRRLYDFGD